MGYWLLDIRDHCKSDTLGLPVVRGKRGDLLIISCLQPFIRKGCELPWVLCDYEQSTSGVLGVAEKPRQEWSVGWHEARPRGSC